MIQDKSMHLIKNIANVYNINITHKYWFLLFDKLTIMYDKCSGYFTLTLTYWSRLLINSVTV